MTPQNQNRPGANRKRPQGHNPNAHSSSPRPSRPRPQSEGVRREPKRVTPETGSADHEPSGVNKFADSVSAMPEYVKGLIALFITILVVAIIVMLFARSLFVPEEELRKNIKTGQMTETQYISAAPTTTQEQVVTTKKPSKKKKSTTEKEDEPSSLPDGMDESVKGDYIVNSAVYLHPEPNSTSANLTTLPQNATVKVYGNVNYGWYYLEYDGQFGYAWGSYLTKQ